MEITSKSEMTLLRLVLPFTSKKGTEIYGERTCDYVYQVKTGCGAKLQAAFGVYWSSPFLWNRHLLV